MQVCVPVYTFRFLIHLVFLYIFTAYTSDLTNSNSIDGPGDTGDLNDSSKAQTSAKSSPLGFRLINYFNQQNLILITIITCIGCFISASALIILVTVKKKILIKNKNSNHPNSASSTTSASPSASSSSSSASSSSTSPSSSSSSSSPGGNLTLNSSNNKLHPTGESIIQSTVNVTSLTSASLVTHHHHHHHQGHHESCSTGDAFNVVDHCSSISCASCKSNCNCDHLTSDSINSGINCITSNTNGNRCNILDGNSVVDATGTSFPLSEYQVNSGSNELLHHGSVSSNNNLHSHQQQQQQQHLTTTDGSMYIHSTCDQVHQKSDANDVDGEGEEENVPQSNTDDMDTLAQFTHLGQLKQQNCLPASGNSNNSLLVYPHHQQQQQCSTTTSVSNNSHHHHRRHHLNHSGHVPFTSSSDSSSSSPSSSSSLFPSNVSSDSPGNLRSKQRSAICNEQQSLGQITRANVNDDYFTGHHTLYQPIGPPGDSGSVACLTVDPMASYTSSSSAHAIGAQGNYNSTSANGSGDYSTHGNKSLNVNVHCLDHVMNEVISMMDQRTTNNAKEIESSKIITATGGGGGGVSTSDSDHHCTSGGHMVIVNGLYDGSNNGISIGGKKVTCSSSSASSSTGSPCILTSVTHRKASTGTFAPCNSSGVKEKDEDATSLRLGTIASSDITIHSGKGDGQVNDSLVMDPPSLVVSSSATNGVIDYDGYYDQMVSNVNSTTYHSMYPSGGSNVVVTTNVPNSSHLSNCQLPSSTIVTGDTCIINNVHHQQQQQQQLPSSHYTSKLGNCYEQHLHHPAMVKMNSTSDSSTLLSKVTSSSSSTSGGKKSHCKIVTFQEPISVNFPSDDDDGGCFKYSTAVTGDNCINSNAKSTCNGGRNLPDISHISSDNLHRAKVKGALAMAQMMKQSSTGNKNSAAGEPGSTGGGGSWLNFGSAFAAASNLHSVITRISGTAAGTISSSSFNVSAITPNDSSSGGVTVHSNVSTLPSMKHRPH